MGVYHPSFCVTVCEQDKDQNARYALGNTGENTLLCFGVNPSTADRYTSDPTMNQLITIAYSNGFDSCIMLNPYPLRTSNPNRLPKQGDPFLLQENRSRIEKIVSQHEGKSALAIWGNAIYLRDYIRTSVLDIIKRSKKYNIQWRHAGTLTQYGNPRHLRSVFMLDAADRKLYEMDIDHYISCL